MQSPEQQRAIVQRMIDAGESEENIATVIRHFKGTTDEPQFQRWYAEQSKRYGLNPDPEGQFYDYRAAFRAGAQPDASGHWPSQFKQAGHPNEVVGGFNTRTGERVPGTPRASEAELVRLGWDAETAKKLASMPERTGLGGTYRDVGVGILKSIGNTVIGAADLASRARNILNPGMRAKEEAEIAAMRGYVGEAEGQAQKTGQFVADVGTAMLPAGRIAKTATEAAAMLNGAWRYGRPLVRGLVEGTGAATIAEAQGQNPLAAGVVGGALPVAGSAMRAARKLGGSPNAVEQAAIDFGKARGVPISAGVATGNPMVRGAQYTADSSLIGGVIGQRASQAESEGLKRVGGELADQASARPVSPYQAGREVQQAIEDKIAGFSQDANAAYDTLRQIEESPALTRTVPIRVKVPGTDLVKPTTKIEMVPMQMPVDLRATKKYLQPLFDRMMRQMPVTQQQSNKALHAIKNILDSPDFAPASVIDMDLSAIKALSRTEGLRSVGEGLAATAVKTLDDAVRTAVRQGGPAAEAALDAGRKATIQKYLAQDVFEQLRDEPVQMFQQATWQKDAGIDRLREMAKLAPAQMKGLGRAYLDDMLTKATSEGGFMSAQALAQQWKNLGPQTKQVLFADAGLVRDLDHFFLLAKRIAENPNPSGSGRIALLGTQGGQFWYDPIGAIYTQFGLGGLSALLHSQRGVQLLTQGLKTSPRAPQWRALTANIAAHLGSNK